MATDQGKEVNPLVIEGSDVRVMPEYAEQWIDPLTHLLTNAVDHGVELFGARMRSGKSGGGNISLSFSLNKGLFRIEVGDDGNGIDVNAVYKKVKEMGISLSKNLSEKEKLALIFTPGLSTAREVTTTSGRGVGMSIVKTMVESRGGTIQIVSEIGKGTTFVIETLYSSKAL